MYFEKLPSTDRTRVKYPDTLDYALNRAHNSSRRIRQRNRRATEGTLTGVFARIPKT